MSEDRLTGVAFAIIPVWILKEDGLSDRAVRLYGIIHGYVGEKDKAWPLQSTLANDLNCSLSSLKTALKELVDIGGVVRTPRYRDGSNEIIGCWYEIVVKNPKAVASGLANPSQRAGYPLASGLATELDTLELDTSKKSCAKKSHDYSDDFEAWWKTYPKPVAKKTTFGCWNATLRERGGTVESIMLATSLFAKQMIEEGRQKQHILNSDTFLGVNERWKDYLPESFSPDILEQAKAWAEYDSYIGQGWDTEEPSFPRPTDGNGNLLDGSGRAYYIDPMQPTKRRYFDDE